ncbi:MAG: TolC family protein [Thermodesulfovibrionales bacterium]|nr:TolC family protein [Thermodesulfovibrionales bacterium]
MACIIAVSAGRGEARAQEKLALTLKGAVDISLERNLSIAEENLLSMMAEAEALSRKGEFEPALKFGLNQAYSREQAVSLIASPEARSAGYDISLGGKVKTGAAYELKWAGGRVKSSANPFLTVNPYYSSDLTLSLTQPLLKGFGKSVQESSLNVARNNVSISRLNAEAKAEDIVAKTAGAYWNLYYARSRYEVAGLSVELAQNLQKEVMARIEAGALAPVEIYKADAELAQRQEALIRDRKAVFDAEDALKEAMNLEDWDSEIVVMQTPPEPGAETETEGFEKAVNEAVQSRSDYMAALAEHKGKAIMSRFYKNQRLPELDLIASSGLNGISSSQGDAIDETGSGRYYSWTVGVSVSIPLGNKGAKGSYLKAKREEERAELNVMALRQRIAFEVREALRAVKLYCQSVAAARATKAASYARLEAEEARFRLGMATVNDVFRFEQEYSQTLSSEKRAISDYATAVIMLEKAKGTLKKVLMP